MKRAYKYKLKPTMKQQQQLMQAFGCARFIYNWGLDKKINAYKEEKKTLSYIDLAKELTLLKKTEEHKWLKDVPNECLQQSLRNMDSAYQNFFKHNSDFPKFKTKKRSRLCAKYTQALYFDFENWKVKVPKCGWVKLCKNETFDLSTCKIGTLTVSRDKCSEFWCSIVVEDNREMKPKAKVSESTAVGIDLGIKDFAVLSDGTKIANPKFYEKAQKRLAVLQCRLSRTKNDSNRHERARTKIAKQQRRISNMRLDFLHKLSTDLIRKYDTICLEDLNVYRMMQNHNLAKSIQSASWFEFVSMLKYKADWNGKTIIQIGRFEPSSKTCHCCGYIKSDLELTDREWTCPQCGTRHDRDVNAALNIKQFILNKYNGPWVSGLKDVEGKVTGLPMNRQDSKS